MWERTTSLHRLQSRSVTSSHGHPGWRPPFTKDAVGASENLVYWPEVVRRGRTQGRQCRRALYLRNFPRTPRAMPGSLGSFSHLTSWDAYYVGARC